MEAIDPDNDTITYSLPVAPDGATIDQQTGKINWEPPAPGEYQFVVQADDGRGGVTTQEYFVTVTQGTANSDPSITSTAPTKATLEQEFSYQVTATDPDGDGLSYYLTDNAPSGMTIDRTTGVITWTPTELTPTPVTTNVRVLDGRGGEATQELNLEVAPERENNDPQINSAPIIDATVNQTYRYDATATDADADPLRFDLLNKPSGMTVDQNTGTIVWNPNLDQVGVHDVLLRVRDKSGGVDLPSELE